ncbi:armadillo-type protein [Geopyxis carbonaria]|nr:armadillo-type protein [Geopyxis carbonaria]
MADSFNPIDTVLSGDVKSGNVLLPVLEKLKEFESDHTQLTEASSKIWIASRDETWRVALGESGILEFFQSLLPASSEPTLTLNALKILGNACAETDTNRQRIVDHPLSLKPIINAISDEETRLVAVIVLTNICLDYDPAQLCAIQHGAIKTIVDALSEENFNDSLDFFLRVLEVLLSHDTGKEATDVETFDIILDYILSEDDQQSFDNTLSLVSILSSLLATPKFQKVTLTTHDGHGFESVLDVIERTYSLDVDAENESKDKSLVAYARAQLIEAVGEIATADTFLTVFPLDSRFMARVRKWLDIELGKEELTVAACLVYGNVGRSDIVCRSLVERGVHVPLLGVVKDTVERYQKNLAEFREMPKEQKEKEAAKSTTGAMAVGVLHAAVGVLKNLSIPGENKKAIADAGGFDMVQSMLAIDGVGAGQVYYSAVSLGRLLVVNTASNAEKFLSPATTGESVLSTMLTRYTTVEELPTKTEISRAIAAVLRIIYSGPSPSQELLDRLISHASVPLALWDMLIQDKYAVVRSEGCFALALLARSPSGAAAVASVLDEQIIRKEFNDGQPKDIDNLGVLLSECKRNDKGGELVENLLGEFMKKKKERSSESGVMKTIEGELEEMAK